MMKYLLVLLTISQMSKCRQPNTNSSTHELKIYFGTAQSWSGGAVGSGRGTNYLFYLAPADSAYRFDSVWVNGYRLALKKRNDYSSKDTLVLSATLFFTGNNPESTEGNSKKSIPDESIKPCCDDASFVIRNIFYGNKNFLSSTSLKILPKLNYP